jgi:hypothetical protein
MNDQEMRNQLVALLRGGEAHCETEEALRSCPFWIAGSRVDALPHTPWRLLEHMRIAQRDILEFSRNPDHVSPEFPDGYWPKSDEPPDEAAWKDAVSAFCRDLKDLQDLVSDPKADLFAPILHGQGQTLFREALLAADHNAYHMGQLILFQRALAR